MHHLKIPGFGGLLSVPQHCGNFREYLRLPAYLQHCAVLQNPGPQRHTRAWSFDYKMQSLQKGIQRCSKYPNLGGGETGQRVSGREVFHAMSPEGLSPEKSPWHGVEDTTGFSWAQEVTMEVLVARLSRSSCGRCGLPPPPALARRGVSTALLWCDPRPHTEATQATPPE